MNDEEKVIQQQQAIGADFDSFSEEAKETLETAEAHSEDAIEAEAPILRRSTPTYYDMSRDISSKYSQIEKEFFAIIKPDDKATFSRTTLCNLIFAICRKLSDDSYLRGKKRTLTGRALNLEDGIPISITMKEIFVFGYGIKEGNARQKRAIKDLLFALNSTPLPIFQDDSDAFEMLLNVRGGKFNENKRGEHIFFNLILNSVFSKLAKNSFGRHPAGERLRLTKIAGKNITSMDSPLLLLLSQQSREKVFPMKKENLLEYLQFTKAYKKDSKQGDNILHALFERMKQMGVLINVKEKEGIYYFYPNRNYGREQLPEAKEERTIMGKRTDNNGKKNGQ